MKGKRKLAPIPILSILGDQIFNAIKQKESELEILIYRYSQIKEIISFLFFFFFFFVFAELKMRWGEGSPN